MTFFKTLQGVVASHGEPEIIKKGVRKKGNVIYGGQSLQAQIGPLARDTRDIDIYSMNPKSDSRDTESKLNRVAHRNNYYTRESKRTKGVYKLYNVGLDLKPHTEDDRHLADYSTPTRKVKVVQVGNHLYADLNETVRDKKESLRNPKYSFRHDKDLEDLRRIKLYKKIFGGRRW